MEYVIYRNQKFFLNQDYSLNLPTQEIENLQDIQGLENLKTIKYLYLDNNKIKHIRCLSKLKNLKILSLKNNKIEVIDGIENLKELEELNLSGNFIKEIIGLDNLPKLKRLYIERNKITKIGGLKNLNNLEILWLNHNKIIKIEGLDNLKKLENLELNNNLIIEISGLDNLVELKVLDLRENQISVISGFQNLTNLREIRLLPNPIPSDLIYKFNTDRYYHNPTQNYVKYCRGDYVEYSEKFYFPENNQLHLFSLGISDLNDVKGLENLSSVELLNLNDNQIKEINFILKLKNLQILWLDLNKIEEIKNLGSSINLENLSLIKNQIETISGLKSLKNLKELILMDNNIQNLSGLESLHHLSVLDLSNNPEINDFTSLQDLISLERLILKNTNISDISILKKMKNLKELDLSNNNITKIPKMNIPHLKWLDLSNNNLKSMESLCQFPNLKYLNLNGNEIEELKCIDKMLKSLNKFYIDNNKLDRDLYDKLKIADNRIYPNSNNSRSFIIYLLLKNLFDSTKDQDHSEIDFNQLIENSNILRKIEYPRLRDLVHYFKEGYEIRCGPNNVPISIVTPKVIATEIVELLKLVGPDKGYPLDHLVNRLHLCNKKAVMRLIREIDKNIPTEIQFYYNNNEIKRASNNIIKTSLSKDLLNMFLKKASEDEITDMFVVPIFQQMNFKNIVSKGHTERINEYGQDIRIMKYKLPTGNVLYFVAQIKKGNIGSSPQQPTQEISNLLAELRQAYDKEIFDDEINRSVLPDHIILIISGRIGEQALNFLNENLEREKKRNLIRINGEKLINLYYEYGLPSQIEESIKNHLNNLR